MLLVTLASFVQVTVLPLLFLDPWSAPLLPVALVAAWSVNRSHDEVWLARPGDIDRHWRRRQAEIDTVWEHASEQSTTERFAQPEYIRA